MRKCKDDFLKANKKRGREKPMGGVMGCANLKANMALSHAVCVWPRVPTAVSQSRLVCGQANAQGLGRLSV